jgi:hypothetical protein
MYPMTSDEDLEQERVWRAHKADLARRKIQAAADVLHREFCPCGAVTDLGCPAMTDYRALALRVLRAEREVVD